MPSPFPGMDPYLEDPRLWPDVHHELISAIRQVLLPGLTPKYFALVEERVYIGDADDPFMQMIIPDVSVGAHDLAAEAGQTTVTSAVLSDVVPITAVTMPQVEIREAYLTVQDRATRDVVTVIEVLSPGNKVRGSAAFENYYEKRDQIRRTDTNLVEIDLLRRGSRPLPLNRYRQADYLIHIWPIRVSRG